MLNLGDEVEAVVLNVNREKQEISLGLKQTEVNPWTIAPQKYPVGAIVTTKVRGVSNFGAFVEIEDGIDGMIHISDLSWTRKYNHPSEVLKRGDEVKCVVLEVNEEKQRISLGIKQMTEDPWIRAIPEKYIPGHIVKGTVTKITNFGAFVELEPELEGLLHISELADHKIEKPQDVVNKGDEIEVKILKVEPESRKIGLSLRRAQWAAAEQQTEAGQQEAPAAVQMVPSDTDTGEVTKPQEKVEESQEAKTEPAEESEQAGASAEAEASDVDEPKETEKTKEAETEQGQENTETESQAGSAEEKSESDTDN